MESISRSGGGGMGGADFLAIYWVGGSEINNPWRRGVINVFWHMGVRIQFPLNKKSQLLEEWGGGGASSPPRLPPPLIFQFLLFRP